MAKKQRMAAAKSASRAPQAKAAGRAGQAKPATRTAQAQPRGGQTRNRPAPRAQRQPVPTTPTYTGSLAQYAAPEGFGAGAYMRAQQAGLTESQIKSGVEELRGQGMKIGARVETALQGPGGAWGGSSTDYGSGLSYNFRPIFMPGQEGVGAQGKGVFFAAGPMTNQQVINMLQGKPRESYVLPASVNAPSQGYKAPTGTSFVDVSASAADQARQAVAGLEIPQLPMVPTPAVTEKATKAKRLAKQAKRKTSRGGMSQGLDKYFGSGAFAKQRYSFS